jgi:hypothetical protein
MKPTNIAQILLLLLSVAYNCKLQAQACYTSSPPAFQAAASPASCTNCNTLNDYIPDPNDPVVEVKINWVYTRPSTGPGVYFNCDINHALASVNDPTLGLSALIATMQTPTYTTTPAAPFVQYPRIKFVLNDYKFVTDDALYYGPNMPDNATGPTPYCVPPAAYLQSDSAITIILNVDTNTYVSGGIRKPNGGYGIAGGIGSHYLNMRLYCTTGGCFVNTAQQPYSDWWANTDIILHELGHCFGLVHSNSTQACVDDYFVESGPCGAPGTWCGGNNVMGYHYTQRKYLSPKQQAKMHFTLATMLNDALVNNAYFTADHNHDLDITSNTTWTYERHMKGNVTVKSGNILTINCRVSMLQDAKIIVEKGAKLIIDGGEVTNLTGRVWRGIEVEGTPNAAHLISNATGFSTNHGIVELKNGAVISHAMFGIYTGRTDDYTLLDIPNSSGGIVIAQNSTFANNVFDIFFYNHTNTNRSKVTSCTFVTDNYIGKDKDGSTELRPTEHIKLYKYYSVNILGSEFKYAAGPLYAAGNRGAGIYSTDANFTVDEVCNNSSNPCTSSTRSTFTNLTTGVWVDNINPTFVATVQNSDFYNQDYWGVIAENANYMAFMNNYVTGQRGMYLYLCKYYFVKQNTFEGIGHSGTGIAVTSSQLGAHQIYSNKIVNWGYGINVQNNNGDAASGLKMNCNDFTSTTGDYNQYDIVLTKATGSSIAPTVFELQSKATAPFTAPDLVRNMYGAPLMGNLKNKWWIDPSNSQNIRHACNSTPSSTDPLPQASPQLMVWTESIPLNYAADCIPNPPSSGGNGPSSVRISNMNEHLLMLHASDYENRNFYEIQATVASQLNFYLSDTTFGNTDSAIAILTRNEGNMQDADVMTVFAYISKGDYTMANDKASTLPADKADWKTLLQKIITVDQRDNGIYSVKDDAAEAALFSDIAATEGKDGRASAQAVMKLVFNEDHDRPLYDVYDEDGMRTTDNKQQADGMKTTASPEQSQLANGVTGHNPIAVYPNPAQSSVTVQVSGSSENVFTVVIRDLLGRSVYMGTVKGESSQAVSLSGWQDGLYMVTVSAGSGETVYQHKLLKQ